jgi:hypothetical protein
VTSLTIVFNLKCVSYSKSVENTFITEESTILSNSKGKGGSVTVLQWQRQLLAKLEWKSNTSDLEHIKYQDDFLITLFHYLISSTLESDHFFRHIIP